MKKHKAFAGQLPALVLFGFLMLTLLLLVVFGTQVYAQAVRGKEENDAFRARMSYLSTQVHAADESGAVQVAESPQGDALVLLEWGEDGAAAYATRIYCCDGWLVEEYAAADADFSPESAQKIVQTAHFSAKLMPGAVQLSTDAGVLHLALRSETGGEG